MGDTNIEKFDDGVYTLLIPSYKPQMAWSSMQMNWTWDTL